MLNKLRFGWYVAGVTTHIELHLKRASQVLRCSVLEATSPHEFARCLTEVLEQLDYSGQVFMRRNRYPIVAAIILSNYLTCAYEEAERNDTRELYDLRMACRVALQSLIQQDVSPLLDGTLTEYEQSLPSKLSELQAAIERQTATCPYETAEQEAYEQRKACA